MREKNDRIYRVVSIVMPVAHALAFLLALAGSYLPYIGEADFYAHHVGALGKLFPQIHPYVILLFPAAACVFAVLAGWVLLGDWLSLRELAGCVLMMGGIVLAQLPQKNK